MQSNKVKTKNNIKRLLGFVFVPIAFTFLSFSIVISSVYLVIGNDAANSVNLFLFKSPPVFDAKISNIFVPSNNTGTYTLPLEKVSFPDYGNVFGKIDIPAVNLSSLLIYGDDDECLSRGAGQYIGSFIPGYGSTTLISGHKNTVFKNLKSVKKGNTINITTTYGIYSYKVTKIAIKLDSDASAYNLETKYDNIILYTCIWQDTPVGSVKMRYFVYADYIKGPRFIK
ncbi:MAG: class D sortase [Clostridia bacterium]|jgi:sortase A